MPETLSDITLSPGDHLSLVAEDGTQFEVRGEEIKDGFLRTTISIEPGQSADAFVPTRLVLDDGEINSVSSLVRERSRLVTGEAMHLYGKKPDGLWFSTLTTKLVSMARI